MADETIEDGYEFDEDRELEPVQGASNAQLILGALFLIIGAVAIYWLVFREPSEGPTRVTAPNTEVEYEPNNQGVAPSPPRIQAPVFPTPEPVQPVQQEPRRRYDPIKAQRDKEALEARMAALEAQRKRMQERMRSEQLIIGGSSFDKSGDSPDLTQASLDALLNAQNTPQTGLGALGGTGSAGGSLGTGDTNTRFFDGVAGGDIPTVRATQIENLTTTIPQGTVIRGVLETAVNSDLPGMLRAIASEDTYSFDGSKNLIPKGSRLIGRYNSSVRAGQTRIFVIWERVIRPDGLSMKLDSPGTDELGVAGMGGDVDTHFFKRYGSAILLSVIEGGIDYAVAEAQDNNSTTISFGDSSDNVSRLAERALERNLDIPPTIHVDQGTRLNVFVSQDLIFELK